jgi:hypothetical protein
MSCTFRRQRKREVCLVYCGVLKPRRKEEEHVLYNVRF